MARIISLLGIIVGGTGIFFGFNYLYDEPILALKIVVITTVGVVGILGFIRHCIFYKSDAKRLGWETDRPDWMFEVGFANLSFGIMGFLMFISNFGLVTYTLIIFGYSIYLMQASFLHLHRYLTGENKSKQNLWISFILTLLFASMMFYFVIYVFVYL